ncbi:MAG: hypothetical protein COW00_06980 [Bdellovibrio sp. CG12_big_fil_rev_8_21_14_0_65_39_13]|nr:MAG: hypothetical protein COW78_03105 [Bdellovibrio sp. CG22_combo_CG10-13_8_21_14_all_39_27]PIQ60347.1 MAG: hypothetical protein COW00_06980 [Bdellovibrio sp. CG12_big_fil_rev_8_21_14_0_65_39_13]PIR35043.1 MAG: hypothetical protein COV37_10480 [Bdellovibrio sp. CG11_big_fil_rev_8_21_14_0_20_39_38]
MKQIFITLSFLVISANSFAVSEEKICEELTTLAEDNCAQAMCEEVEAEGYECVRDGDFYEGLGICVYDDELPILIRKYNSKNPTSKVACED